MATDAFTYSNGVLPTVSGGVWVDTPAADFNVLTNAIVVQTATVLNINLYGTQAAGQTQFSELVVTFTGTTSPYCEMGMCVRATGPSSIVCYYAYVNNQAQAELVRVGGTFASPTFTSIAGPTTILSTAGTRTYRLEATGSTIRLLQNGSQILTATDATLTGLYCGVFGFKDTATNHLTADDWSGLQAASPQTWSGSNGTMVLTGTSGGFTSDITWVGSDGSMLVSGTSGTFISPTTWAGTGATVLVSGTSGSFISPSTWGGSNGTMLVTGNSDVMVGSGTITWSGSNATLLVTGTVDTMVGSGTTTWSGSNGTIAVAGTAGAFATGGTSVYPKTISGRQLLDQNGSLYLDYNFASWEMASQLSNAEMDIELAKIAGRGFKSIVVMMGGTEDGGSWGGGHHQHQNNAGQNFWPATPWTTPLGAAWTSVDHLLSQAEANGLFVWFSFCDGNSTNHNGQYWVAVSNTDMYNVGVALATRYASVQNMGWHIMLDTTVTVGSTKGQRLQFLFDGINDTESTTLRRVRWMEGQQGNSTFDQGWYDPNGVTTNSRMTINSYYEYGSDAAAIVESHITQTAGPIADCEPPYAGAPHYTIQPVRQLRQRNYTLFIEGGCLMNFGHEDYWHFKADGLFSAGLTWDNVLDDSPEVADAEVAWNFLEAHVKRTGWSPTFTPITTGEGTGADKAAQGGDGAVAACYFPTNRTIQVNTSLMNGTSNVMLRWFDPVLGTFSTIAASEPQQTGRSVTMPAARGDGTRDFILLIELDPNQNWAGSNGTIVYTGTSDVMTPGPSNWTGSNTGGLTIVGTSGSFGVSGSAPWFSVNATITVLGQSGSFTGFFSPQTWLSTGGTITYTGFSSGVIVEDLSIRVGATLITKVYLGTVQLNKIYLGSTLL